MKRRPTVLTVAAGAIAVCQGLLVLFLAMIVGALGKMDSGTLSDRDGRVVMAIGAVGLALLVVGAAAIAGIQWGLIAVAVVGALAAILGIVGLATADEGRMAIAVWLLAPAVFAVILATLALRQRGRLAA